MRFKASGIAIAAVISAIAVAGMGRVAYGLLQQPDTVRKGGCQLVVLGHLYSLQPYPELMGLLVDHINAAYPDASAVISLGDNTVHGSEREWEDFFAAYGRLHAPMYFAPGNHDVRTEAAYETYMERVGYTTRIAEISNCNLGFVNTVNEKELDFNDVEMVKGGGLDAASMNLVRGMEREGGHEANLLFMHHALFSIGVVHHDDEWNDELNRIYENEKRWRESVQPLIRDRFDAVFAGDHTGSSVYGLEIDGIPYLVNSFGSAFDPEPTTNHRPLTYTVVTVDEEGNVASELRYLPVPVTSAWYAFDRDARYQDFADDYDDGYDRKAYTYPNP